MGLRIRLEIFIITAFLPLVGLVLSLYLQQWNADIEHARQRVLMLAEQGASQQADAIARVRETLQTLILIPAVQRHRSEDCGPPLRRVLSIHLWSTGFAVAAPDGRILCRTLLGGSPVTTVADQDYFRRAVATKTFSTSNFRVGRGSGKPLLAAALPILDDDGEVEAVLLAGLDLKWLGDLSSAAAEAPGTTVTLFDAQGTILAREPGPSPLIGKAMAGHAVTLAIFQADHGIVESAGFEGHPRIIGFATLEDTGGRIAVGVPRDLVLDKVNRKMMWGIAILAGVVATIVVGVWFLLDILVLRGLRDLQQSVTDLSAGRIDSAAKSAANGFRTREIDSAAQAIHDMGATLHGFAYKDQLTALGNRRYLEAKIRELADLPPGRRMTVAALCIDLDDFKPVNDRHGHHVGDAVLAEVGRRLLHCVRDGDEVIRLGGDEFLVCLALPQADWLTPQDVAARIIASLSSPIRLQGVEIGIGCSIGMALWPVDDTDFDTVLRYADQALYAAKHNGRGQVGLHGRPVAADGGSA
ncbi:diguanylate cyclase domain-containing protein [Azospirillum sp. TSH100]|uniref:sensor domain-containing diguanylate cyclase n=1 Tax=Azospirillum sp. TSH100 TaxID=652764 RepID=UPI0020002D8A|nr:diguanylate cyclase [Azospirillum sp. TSH100]